MNVEQKLIETLIALTASKCLRLKSRMERETAIKHLTAIEILVQDLKLISLEIEQRRLEEMAVALAKQRRKERRDEAQ